MTEENFWLMNYDPVVIAMDLKNEINYSLMYHVPVGIVMDLENQLNSVHTLSTLFAIDSRSTIRGN